MMNLTWHPKLDLGLGRRLSSLAVAPWQSPHTLTPGVGARCPGQNETLGQPAEGPPCGLLSESCRSAPPRLTAKGETFHNAPYARQVSLLGAESSCVLLGTRHQQCLLSERRKAGFKDQPGRGAALWRGQRIFRRCYCPALALGWPSHRQSAAADELSHAGVFRAEAPTPPSSMRSKSTQSRAGQTR